jgi:CheY-like chemotaxis protein
MARRRVVVADDDPDVRAVLADYLAQRGFDVAAAANGLEALLQVKREKPHAVVLDISMPRLGGLDALKRIRDYTPSTRVVVYSAILEPDLEAQALAAGAVAALKKPGSLEALARAVDGAPAPARPAAPGTSRERELRILLIDDDPAVNHTLAEIITQHRSRVFPVSSATDAFKLLAYGAPDVIFLDIRMPGLSGIEALPTIRALAPDAKVVMLSGLADETTRKQAFARGAFDFIAKPIDFAHLARTLETIRSMTVHDL